MATRVMVIWVLALSVVWALALAGFINFFNLFSPEKKMLAALRRQINQQNRKMAKMELKFEEYKESLVQAGIKIDDDTKWTDTKRILASVMAKNSDSIIRDQIKSHQVFREAKSSFLGEKFKRSAELFDDFLEKYPDHPDLPEAGYLLAEAEFQNERFEACVRAVDFVVTHFPETEYSGLTLVRLAKVFEKQQRIEEAADIYKTIQGHYPKSLASQLASENLRDLNL